MATIVLRMRPKVSGVAVVTRKGVVVGQAPTPLPSKIAKKIEEIKAAGEQSDETCAQESEDPF